MFLYKTFFIAPSTAVAMVFFFLVGVVNPLTGSFITNFLGLGFVAICFWICSTLVRASFYADRIDGHFAFYRTRLLTKGITLKQVSGSSDEAPCESEFIFLAPTVRIQLGSIRSWKLIRLIYHNKISLKQLESMSKFEYEKTPTI